MVLSHVCFIERSAMKYMVGGTNTVNKLLLLQKVV